MEIIGGMPYSDIVVHSVLKALVAERGEDAVISQSLICERSQMPLTTVQYALRRLRAAGRVEGRFVAGRNGGYTYRICDAAPAERQ